MKKKWLESSNGPDWIDVFGLMRLIEEYHRVVVTVCFTSSVLDGPGGIMAIAAYSMQGDAPVMGTPVMAMSGAFPCHEHKTVTACIFAGLYRLDHDLGKKQWEQIKLPFTAE